VRREGKTLAEVTRADPRASGAIGAKEIASLFEPERCFGASAAMIERALADWSRSIKA
jgi:hypothetical protein